MVQTVHDEAGRFAISIWPRFDNTTENYKEMLAIGGILPHTTSGRRSGGIYDAHNPQARALFWKQARVLWNLGVDAIWSDGTEPETGPTVAQQRIGNGPNFLGPAAKYLNTFCLEHMKMWHEGWLSEGKNRRVFILPRNGFAGQQRYGAVPWSGDIACRWEVARWQVVAGLNFIATGAGAAWTFDAGGYAPDAPFVKGEAQEEWRELQARWHQFAAFAPVMRTHGRTLHREIYEIAPSGTEAYAAIQAAIELRYRLLPYIYSLHARNHYEDITTFRVMAFDFPEESELWELKEQ
jgi:alpha-D-xyloside xylohydrolase